MIISFKNDDQAYEKWCKNHPDGYILNRGSLQKKAESNKLHLASCTHLNRGAAQKQQTFKIAKVCSNELSEIMEEAKDLCDEEWDFCQTCRKKILGNTEVVETDKEAVLAK